MTGGSIACSTCSTSSRTRACDPGCTQVEGHRRDRRAVRSLHPAWSAGTHSLRQRSRVRGQGRAEWIAAVGATTAYVGPAVRGRTLVESFNARLRDELLDGETVYSLKEAQIVIESWRRHSNAVRPHESLGYRPPAPEVFVPALAAWPSARFGSAPTATLRGVETWVKLTFKSDHSMGADQNSSGRSRLDCRRPRRSPQRVRRMWST